METNPIKVKPYELWSRAQSLKSLWQKVLPQCLFKLSRSLWPVMPWCTIEIEARFYIEVDLEVHFYTKLYRTRGPPLPRTVCAYIILYRTRTRGPLLYTTITRNPLLYRTRTRGTLLYRTRTRGPLLYRTRPRRPATMQCVHVYLPLLYRIRTTGPLLYRTRNRSPLLYRTRSRAPLLYRAI